MEDRTPAEDLPTLYRAVLDTVSRLERVGDRSAAWKIRRDALQTYSTRWDDTGQRRLRKLVRDAQRRLASYPASSLGALNTRSEPV